MEDYHIFTKGMEDKLLFRDTMDYNDGMNSIPLALQGTDCRMLAFCLMSNHVHFVLSASQSGALAFISAYKQRLAMAIRKKYNEPKALAGLEVSVKEIGDEDYLRTVIAYVIRNPLAAGMKEMPYNYPWSSGKCYYGKDGCKDCVKLSDLTENMRRKLLKTRRELAPWLLNCTLDDSGVVLPSSYLSLARVETIYGTPGRFLYFISRKNDDSIEADMSKGTIGVQDDTTIRKYLQQTCLDMFGTEDFGQLTLANKNFLAGIARKRLGATDKQLSRIMGLKIIR